MRSIVYPDFYNKFKCTAGECSFTCCQEWKIAVDESTLSAWKTKSLEGIKGTLSEYVDEGAILLNNKRVCPFLDEKKLCKVVLNYGEQSISTTCHTFPRESHIFEEIGYEEQTLTMACPAALDLLWKHGLKVETPSVEGEMSQLLFLRAKCMEQLRKQKYSIEEALLINFFVLLDLDEQGEEADYEAAFYEDSLEELHEAIVRVEKEPYASFMERNELFLDLAVNYRNNGMYKTVLEPLAEEAERFEILQENEYASVSDRVEVFEKELANYEKLMRLLVEEEIFSTMVLPESDLYSMLIKLQWISLTYATIKHCLFLRYEKTKELTRESIKEITVLILRMTGYSEADMEEYLENCFEEIIWDWGYMALIL